MFPLQKDVLLLNNSGVVIYHIKLNNWLAGLPEQASSIVFSFWLTWEAGLLLIFIETGISNPWEKNKRHVWPPCPVTGQHLKVTHTTKIIVKCTDYCFVAKIFSHTLRRGKIATKMNNQFCTWCANYGRIAGQNTSAMMRHLMPTWTMRINRRGPGLMSRH